MGAFCCKSTKKERNTDFGAELSNDIGHEAGEREPIRAPEFVIPPGMIDYLKEHLGPLSMENNESGVIKFEDFKAIYLTSIMWNRVIFDTQRRKFIEERREALKADDKNLYAEIVMNSNDFDQEILAQVFNEVQLFVKISEENFTKALERHAEDQELMKQI